jgi:hypothetical protein
LWEKPRLASIQEKHALKVSENRVLRRICESKTVTGHWRKLYNKKLVICSFSQTFSADKIKMVEMGRACSTHGIKNKCIYNFSLNT